MRLMKFEGKQSVRLCENYMEFNKKWYGFGGKMGKIIERKNKYSDYEIASFLEMEKFEEKHPIEKRPEWLQRYILVTGEKTGDKSWIIRRILFHKIQLAPNQHWEKSTKGNPLLIEVDPITGNKSVVISRSYPADYDLIFEVEVNFTNSLVNILVDIDLDVLDENKYQVQRA